MEAIMPLTAFLPETFCTAVKKVMLSAAELWHAHRADLPATPDTF